MCASQNLRERAAEALTIKVEDLAVTISRDPLIGAEFAGYKLMSTIGRGGMGAVYLASSEQHEGPVAVKVMLPELTGNEEFRNRFIREAHSGLDHPNIVPILDAGEIDDVLYITMRYVDGVDLKALIAREGKLNPGRVVNIFEQTAAALDEAHEQGVVHRDVKPQNILIKEPEGSMRTDAVYLTDFGLVKRISSQSSFTTSTYLMGSLHYMAPEQIEGKPLDGRTDVYALGCVLHECLTGRVPFDKESEVAVLWAHMNEDPPSAIAAEPLLPDAIDVIVAKAMAKSPEDRFLTAGELASALALEFGASRGRVRSVWGPGQISASGRRSRPLKRELAARQAASALPAPPPAAPRTKGFVFGVAAAWLLFAMWFGFSTEARRDAVGEFLNNVAEAAPLIGGETTVDALESQKGFRASSDPRRQTSDPSGSRPVALSLADIAREVADHSEDTVRGDEGSSDVQADAQADPASMSQGRIVYSKSDTYPVSYYSLWTMNADGSDERMLYSTSVQRDDYTPEWSPDGTKIAFTSGFSIKTIGADGTGEANVENMGGWARDPAWSPDGEYIAFGHNPNTGEENRHDGEWDIWVAPSDGSSTSVRLTDSPGLDGWPDWSPDGSRIAFSSERDGIDRDICTIVIETLTTRCLARSGNEMQPAWSPDGNRIAFVAQKLGEAGYDLFVLKLRTGRIHRVTDTRKAYYPRWSPNGKWIVFSGGRANEWDMSTGVREQEIRKVRASGRGPIITLTDTESAVESDPDWWAE